MAKNEPEEKAAIMLQKAYRNRQLTDGEADQADKIRRQNTASDNITAMCSSALDLAKRETFQPWTVTHAEWGAKLYDWWTMAAICPLPQWRFYCRAYAACNSLLMFDPVTIAYRRIVNGREETISRPRNHGIANYRGPIAFGTGPRNIWKLSEVQLWERAVGGRIVAGDGLINNSDEIDWAGEMIVENLAAFNFGNDPLAAMNRLEVRNGQWFRIYRHPSGYVFAICARSTHHTRGPIGAVECDPKTGILTGISPSIQRSGGEWWKVTGSVNSRFWELESEGPEGTVRTIGGKMPADCELIIWDRNGARAEGGEPVVEWIQAVSEKDIDAIGAQLDPLLDTVTEGTEQWEATRGYFEVLKRSLRGNRGGTIQGAKDVASKVPRQRLQAARSRRSLPSKA